MFPPRAKPPLTARKLIVNLPPREPPARINPIHPFNPSGGSRITASSLFLGNNSGSGTSVEHRIEEISAQNDCHKRTDAMRHNKWSKIGRASCRERV